MIALILSLLPAVQSDVQYQWFSDSMEAICDQPFSQVQLRAVPALALRMLLG